MRTIPTGRQWVVGLVALVNEHLNSPSDDVARYLHDTRKLVKETRAVLWSMSDVWPKSDQWRRTLGDLNRRLSFDRDQFAMLETIEQLRETVHLSASVLSKEAVIELGRRMALNTHHIESKLVVASKELMDFKDELESQVDDKALTHMPEYLTQRLHRAMESVLDGREVQAPTSPEGVHNYRKKVKRSFYFLRHFRRMGGDLGIGPQDQRELEALLKDLGETLGHHHDLSVLIDRAESLGGAELFVQLHAAATKARSKLEAELRRAFESQVHPRFNSVFFRQAA